MIKHTDLRIGNAVAYNWSNEEPERIFMVREIVDRGSFINPEYKVRISDKKIGVGSISEENLIPVKLTQEWFEKFGFEAPAEMSADFQKNGIIIYAGHHEWWYGFEKDLQVRLDYVHQLQNLFFALTGEELKIAE